MGNKIDIEVLQRDNMHTKILSCTSHMYLVITLVFEVFEYLFYYFRNWTYSLDSFYIMIQGLKMGGVY